MKRRSSAAVTQEQCVSPNIKRTKVQAQRKFAQGSYNYTYSTPKIVAKTPECVFPSFQPIQQNSLENEECELNNFSSLPTVDDFLTFLCFRETDVLPERLNYLNSPQFDVLPIKKKYSKANNEVPSIKTSVAQNREPRTAQTSPKSDINKKERKLAECKLRSYSLSTLKHDQRLRSKNISECKLQTLKSKNQSTNKFTTHVNKLVADSSKSHPNGPLTRASSRSEFDKNVKPDDTLGRVTRRNSALQQELADTEGEMEKPKETQNKKTVPEKVPSDSIMKGISIRLEDSAYLLKNPSSRSSTKTAVINSPVPLKSAKGGTRCNSVKIEQTSNRNTRSNSLLQLDEPSGKSTNFSSTVPDDILASRSTRSNSTQLDDKLSTPDNLYRDEVSTYRSTRPSRKTKEAAALYMEMLGRELLSAEMGFDDDDDDMSVESFPELPNAEQHMRREKELKELHQKKNLKKPPPPQPSPLSPPPPQRKSSTPKLKTFPKTTANCGFADVIKESTVSKEVGRKSCKKDSSQGSESATKQVIKNLEPQKRLRRRSASPPLNDAKGIFKTSECDKKSAKKNAVTGKSKNESKSIFKASKKNASPTRTMLANQPVKFEIEKKAKTLKDLTMLTEFGEMKKTGSPSRLESNEKELLKPIIVGKKKDVKIYSVDELMEKDMDLVDWKKKLKKNVFSTDPECGYKGWPTDTEGDKKLSNKSAPSATLENKILQQITDTEKLKKTQFNKRALKKRTSSPTRIDVHIKDLSNAEKAEKKPSNKSVMLPTCTIERVKDLTEDASTNTGDSTREAWNTNVVPKKKFETNKNVLLNEALEKKIQSPVENEFVSKGTSPMNTDTLACKNLDSEKKIFKKNGSFSSSPEVNRKSEAFSADNENSVYAFEPDLPTTSPPSPPFRRLKPSTPSKSTVSNSIAVQVNFGNDVKVECSSTGETQVSSTTDCGDRVFYIPIPTSTVSSTLGVALKLGTDGPNQKIIIGATLITNSPTFTTNTVTTRTCSVDTMCTQTETPKISSSVISVDYQDDQPCSSTSLNTRSPKKALVPNTVIANSKVRSVKILKLNNKKSTTKPKHEGMEPKPGTSSIAVQDRVFGNRCNTRKLSSASIEQRLDSKMSFTGKQSCPEATGYMGSWQTNILSNRKMSPIPTDTTTTLSSKTSALHSTFKKRIAKLTSEEELPKKSNFTNFRFSLEKSVSSTDKLDDPSLCNTTSSLYKVQRTASTTAKSIIQSPRYSKMHKNKKTESSDTLSDIDGLEAGRSKSKSQRPAGIRAAKMKSEVKSKRRLNKIKNVRKPESDTEIDEKKATSSATGEILEAPTFHPTQEEFSDPLEYIETVRQIGEKFGLCRIIPPSNFRPDCKVNDGMRFTAYNQYVHKMLNRWGPNVKEMMAIKKFLATQNIQLTQAPRIGGMEIDLPRLYQVVQQCGGLSAVIENERWFMAADIMKIPKLAQDRITKLDDIYCKYLLPYDILSHEEREKLFEDIEKEWLSHLENPSEEEIFEDIDECITKGRTMALSCFYRTARNTMMMCSANTDSQQEPSIEMIEEEFWNLVSQGKSHLCVHCGSVDSGSEGYGFSMSKNSAFRKHPWNLKVLTNNAASILRFLGPIMGVTVPTLHFGMLYSACCWYRDPHGFPWIEYLHTGANKIWYGIPDEHSEQFKAAMLTLVPRYCRDKKIWLPSDTVMIPPPLLTAHGVSLSKVVQEPGQFIVVFPKAFTSSISTGYLVSEIVYFAYASWLDSAKQIFEDMQESGEPPVFSLEQLLMCIGEDARPSLPLLDKILPLLIDLRETEVTLRKQLKDQGVNTVEKLNVSKKRKSKSTFQEDDYYECDICHANLHVSMVENSLEQCNYCLKHAASLLQQNSVLAKDFKLLYVHTLEALDDLIEKVKSKIEAKNLKKSHN